MKSLTATWICGLFFLTVTSCTSSGGSPEDAAASAGTGGAGNSGGNLPTGGNPSTGGETSAGGRLATGGAPGAGGFSNGGAGAGGLPTGGATPALGGFSSGGVSSAGGSLNGGASPGAGGSQNGGATPGAGGRSGSSSGGSSGGGAISGGRGGSAGGSSGGVSGGTGGTVATGGSVGGAPPACTGAAVKATLSGTTYTLDNGLIQAKVNTSDATMPSFIINGVETMTSGGYFSWGTNVYTAGPFTGSLSADPSKNGGDVAEVAMTTKWDGSSGKIPLDLEVRFAMPRCAQGLYGYVVLTHPASYPAFTPGELRYNHYVQWDSVFDWYAVDDVRRGVFTSVAASEAATAVAGAPQEVLKYASGPFADRPGWQKYDNSLEWGEGTVYGWSSSKKNIGLWMINPSNEYLPGGPMKTELTLHDAPGGKATLLNYWGGTHFYGDLEDVKANQVREKVCGPWFLYANSTTTAGNAGQDALWADAKQRLIWEKAAWPYSWETDTRYPPKSGRGTVTGQMTFTDAAQPTASVANAWVGLADPPVNGAPNFEHQAWDYQYWVHADGQGNFNLTNVRPGNYTLHAFVAGIHGVYIGQSNAVVVTAGGTTALGAVTWTPDRKGPTVWEIGIPDRVPREFYRGDQAWHYGTNLLFSKDFPSGINYTVGTSDPAKDWNFLQPGGTWNVKFNIDSIPSGATGASLVLDSAGSNGVTLSASFNGTKVGSSSISYDDSSIARDQPHGVWVSGRIAVPLAQIKTGANTLAITSSGNMMWDYLRLEWVTS
jgi:rhamnogalacturonan endolyase